MPRGPRGRLVAGNVWEAVPGKDITEMCALLKSNARAAGHSDGNPDGFPGPVPRLQFLPSTILFSLGTGASETLMAQKSLLSFASGDLPSTRLIS